MTKREADIKAVLNSLCKNHHDVEIQISGFRLRGSISKSKHGFHVGTSTSLFKLLPKEIICIKNLNGETLV